MASYGGALASALRKQLIRYGSSGCHRNAVLAGSANNRRSLAAICSSRTRWIVDRNHRYNTASAVNRYSLPQRTVCPHCRCDLNVTHLERHVTLRCPKAPDQILRARPQRKPRRRPRRRGAFTGLLPTALDQREFISHPPRKCRFCGKPSMPGSDLCYTCESD